MSQPRAEAVLRKLTDHGVDEVLLTARGYAESMPIADNKRPESRADNRRVEISIQAH